MEMWQLATAHDHQEIVFFPRGRWWPWGKSTLREGGRIMALDLAGWRGARFAYRWAFGVKAASHLWRKDVIRWQAARAAKLLAAGQGV